MTALASPPRARDLGVPFVGAPGPSNAITDVGGVEVGYTTLISGAGPLSVGSGPVRTGVTAVLPRGRARVGDACTAGWYSLNGNGEMTGTTWIEEGGALALPIVITNTHAVGPCHQGAIAWALETHPELAHQWLLPVVAETWAFSTANDGSLSATPSSASYDMLQFVPWSVIDPLYAAVVQSIEEAVINALVAAPEMVGVDGRRSPRLPHDVVVEAFGFRPQSI